MVILKYPSTSGPETGGSPE